MKVLQNAPALIFSETMGDGRYPREICEKKKDFEIYIVNSPKYHEFHRFSNEIDLFLQKFLL